MLYCLSLRVTVWAIEALKHGVGQKFKFWAESPKIRSAKSNACYFNGIKVEKLQVDVPSYPEEVVSSFLRIIITVTTSTLYAPSRLV
jgi:hypothetical protein